MATIHFFDFRSVIKRAPNAPDSGGASAGRCIRKLEGVSDSGPPVARPPATVCHSDNLDIIAAKEYTKLKGYRGNTYRRARLP